VTQQPTGERKVLFVGDEVEVPTKNPVTTYRWWGFVVTIFSWLVVVAVRSGKLPAELQEAITGLGLDIIAGIIGALGALIGGWRANQPLSFGDKVHVNKMVKLVPIACCLMLVVGCGANNIPADWVKAERDTYNAVAPDYLNYVLEDVDLPEVEKQDTRNTLESWDRRLDAKEQQMKLPNVEEPLPAPSPGQ
jgi:hypothetical protein